MEPEAADRNSEVGKTTARHHQTATTHSPFQAAGTRSTKIGVGQISALGVGSGEIEIYLGITTPAIRANPIEIGKIFLTPVNGPYHRTLMRREIEIQGENQVGNLHDHLRATIQKGARLLDVVETTRRIALTRDLDVEAQPNEVRPGILIAR